MQISTTAVRAMRRSMPPSHRAVWNTVRGCGVGPKVHRFHPIRNGGVLDFYSHPAKFGVVVGQRPIDDQEMTRRGITYTRLPASATAEQILEALAAGGVVKEPLKEYVFI